MAAKNTGKPKYDKQVCTRCGRDLSIINFWNSDSDIHKATGKMSVCSDCCNEMFVENYKHYKGILNDAFELNSINIDYDSFDKALYKTCRLLDIRFSYSVINYVREYLQNKNKELTKNGEAPFKKIFGVYKNKVTMTYGRANNGGNPAVFEFSDMLNKSNIPIKKMTKQQRASMADELPEDVIVKWGVGYTQEEYIYLENYSRKLKEQNKVETVQDEDYINKIAMVSLLLNRALTDNDAASIQKLSTVFSKFMADAQLRNIDATQVDKTGGIRTWGQMATEVESDDFVWPWEKYAHKLQVPQDIVDKTIMCLQNFYLKFNDKGLLSQPMDNTPKVDDIDA